MTVGTAIRWRLHRAARNRTDHRQCTVARSRRSAPSPRCARSAPAFTASPSRHRGRPPAGSPKPMRARQTTTPSLAAIDFPAMELYAMPAAAPDPARRQSGRSREPGWRAKCRLVFAQQEGAAFVAGDGTTQAQGFLSDTTSPTPVELGQSRLYRRAARTAPLPPTILRCAADPVLRAQAGLQRQRHAGC